jgi:hypothetical protein
MASDIRTYAPDPVAGVTTSLMTPEFPLQFTACYRGEKKAVPCVKDIKRISGLKTPRLSRLQTPCFNRCVIHLCAKHVLFAICSMCVDIQSTFYKNAPVMSPVWISEEKDLRPRYSLSESAPLHNTGTRAAKYEGPPPPGRIVNIARNLRDAFPISSSPDTSGPPSSEFGRAPRMDEQCRKEGASFLPQGMVRQNCFHIKPWAELSCLHEYRPSTSSSDTLKVYEEGVSGRNAYASRPPRRELASSGDRVPRFPRALSFSREGRIPEWVLASWRGVIFHLYSL